MLIFDGPHKGRALHVSAGDLGALDSESLKTKSGLALLKKHGSGPLPVIRSVDPEYQPRSGDEASLYNWSPYFGECNFVVSKSRTIYAERHSLFDKGDVETRDSMVSRGLAFEVEPATLVKILNIPDNGDRREPPPAWIRILKGEHKGETGYVYVNHIHRLTEVDSYASAPRRDGPETKVAAASQKRTTPEQLGVGLPKTRELQAKRQTAFARQAADAADYKGVVGLDRQFTFCSWPLLDSECREVVPRLGQLCKKHVAEANGPRRRSNALLAAGLAAGVIGTFGVLLKLSS